MNDRSPKRTAANSIKLCDATRCTGVPRRTVGCTLAHGHTHGRAWLRPLQHGHAAPVHGRASLRPFPLALLGLRLTSIFPSIPPESYLSRPNPKLLPGSTNKPQYKHKWIKGSKSVPFSCRFSIEIRRNRDQIRAKRGQNRGLSTFQNSGGNTASRLHKIIGKLRCMSIKWFSWTIFAHIFLKNSPSINKGSRTFVVRHWLLSEGGSL